MTIEDAFVKQITNLINSLSELDSFPFIIDNKTLITTAINMNPKKTIQSFIKYVLKFENKIESKDENFFLTFDFDKEYRSVINDEYLQYFNKIFEFKQNWKTLSDHNKNIIIKYLIILCKLSKRYDEEYKNLY